MANKLKPGDFFLYEDALYLVDASSNAYWIAFYRSGTPADICKADSLGKLSDLDMNKVSIIISTYDIIGAIKDELYP